MRSIVPILAGLALSGCAAHYEPLADYHMPAQCTKAALDQITITVVQVPKITVRDDNGHRMNAYGYWDDRTDRHVIMVLRGLPPKILQETLDHERCHELMWRLTGDGRWHSGEMK